MPQLQQFTADTLPEHLGWQILDFTRMEWFDIFTELDEAEVHPDFWHPTYFVMTKYKALLSNATVFWKVLVVKDAAYRTYGIGGVMTYPAFRKQGYGQQVVTAATDFIRQQADADLAILWANSDLEAFYNQAGWEYPRDFTVTFGEIDNPEISEFPMLLYLSDKGRALRESLAGQSLYFGEHYW